MNGKILGLGFGVLCTCVVSVAVAATPSSTSGTFAAKSLNAQTPSTQTGSFLSGAPDWMSRVRGEILFDTESAPRFSLETTQPLWQSDDDTHTVFTQGRVSWTDHKWTMNIGSGYRYLTPSHDWILGGNAFLDAQLNDGHRRLGFGAEAMQSYLTMRTNVYKGFSGWKTIESAPNYTIQERALSGYDFGVDGPLPYLSWARLYANYYNWNATTASDIHGIQTKIRMDLMPNISLDVGGSADNAAYSLFTKISLSLGPSRTSDNTLLSKPVSDKAFEPRDLKKHTLDRVERQNDIVTERRTLAAGSVTGVRVVIRRGS